MPTTTEELNQIDMEKADSLAGAKDYGQALKIYGDVLKRSKTVMEQQNVLDRINYIKAQLKKPESKEQAHKESPKREKEGHIEFKIYPDKFPQIIGLNYQKKLLFKKIYNAIHKAEMYKKLDRKPSFGIILYGPAGVGKTGLAKAASGELNIPMADVHLSEIMSKFVGESEKRLKQVFEDAKLHAPCIIFFDELDALATSRDSVEHEGAGTEVHNTITEFLKQMSDLNDNPNSKIFVIGSTNLPQNIDSAMKRSGRFDFLIYTKPPGFLDRKKLFKRYLNVQLEYLGNIDWNLLSLATCDYSPADIKKVCEQAKDVIIDKGGGTITTRKIQLILKDKNIGASSLDNWYLSTYAAYVKRPKYKKIGKEKQMIEKGGAFKREELIMYKELVNDTNRFQFYYNGIRIIRFLACGIFIPGIPI